MTDLDDPRTCPACGKPPGEGSFCQFCGQKLAAENPTELQVPPVQLAPNTALSDATLIKPDSFPPPPPPPPGSFQQSPVASGLSAQPVPGSQSAPHEIDETSADSHPKLVESEKAHWGYRTGAFWFQLGLTFLIGICVAQAGEASGWTEDQAQDSIPFTVFSVWFFISYIPVLFTQGQSLGMFIAGTRMVDREGEPVGPGRAFLREYVCAPLFFLPFFMLIEWLMPLSATRRSVRDNIAKTDIVKTPVYKKRAGVLVVATIAVVGAWFVLTLVDPYPQEFDEQANRAEFVSECVTGENTDDESCNCIYDEWRSNYSETEWIDFMSTYTEDELPASVDEEISYAVDVCL